MRIFVWSALVLLLFGCASNPNSQSDAKIVIYGDSAMAWNGFQNQSVGDYLSQILDQPVANFAVSGARVSHPRSFSGASLGLDIRRQVRPGFRDWTIVNGAANDLLFECACGACNGVINGLISQDAMMGELPTFLSNLRRGGGQVMYVSYHRTKGRGGMFRGCVDDLNIVDERLERFALARDGIHFMNMHDIFNQGAGFLALDGVHPSPKGSEAIAARIADLMKSNAFGLRKG